MHNKNNLFMAEYNFIPAKKEQRINEVDQNCMISSHVTLTTKKYKTISLYLII